MVYSRKERDTLFNSYEHGFSMQDLAVHLDFETGSRTDLRTAGMYRYAEDPTTRVWCFSYQFFKDGKALNPVQHWTPGMPDPVELLTHVEAGGRVVVHNAAFERTIWNLVLVPRYAPHWPRLFIWQQDCTMARAAAIAHPQKLENLGKILGLRAQKDMVGSALMQKMCKPRRVNPDGTLEWWDSEADIKRLVEYCDQDVCTEAEADLKVPPLTAGERQVWMFDQVINDRGVPIDVHAASRCAELVEYAKKQADSVMRTLTNRTVPKCSNDGKLIEWVKSRGLECTTVKKAVQDDIIFMAELNNDSLVRNVMELRRASKKTSTAKYKAMLKCVCADGRIRGMLNYHGASTGRWAGRLVQPQNLPRLDFEQEGHIITWLHELLRDDKLSIQDVYELISAVHGPIAPLVILSRALRSMIKAPPGKKLVGADFSNIEGRMNAWFAGETWKLQAFTDYDTVLPGEFDKKGKPKRVGPDLYVLAASGILGKPLDAVSGFERQSVGKVSELALGFQGSVGAFISMGDNYGITPYDISGYIHKSADPSQWDHTAAVYAEKGTVRHGLQEKEWTAVKIVVDNWRKKNPAIVQMWWDLQDAAIAAVSAPGQIIAVCGGKVSYYCDGAYLWTVLPGGRMLCYAEPTVVTEKVERIKPDGTKYTTLRNKVMFWGEDGETKQWVQSSLYGGLQCENIVQAAARDVMCDRLFAAEKAGFKVILTVHDEGLTEVDKYSEYHTDKTLQAIMSVVPKDFQGLPLTAAAWEDERYVK